MLQTNKRNILIVIFVICIVFPTTLAFCNVNAPLINSDWVYCALLKLQANGLVGQVFINNRPLDRDLIRETIADLERAISSGVIKVLPYEGELVKKLLMEFSKDKDLNFREEVTGLLRRCDQLDGRQTTSSLSSWSALELRLSQNIRSYWELNISRGDQTKGLEGTTAGSRLKVWKYDYTADFREAYLMLDLKNIRILFGRAPLFWGPSYRGSLILSGNSPPFDMLLMQMTKKKIKVQSFTAMLDKMWSERGEQAYRYLANRYMSGHRFDWAISKDLELGVSEVIVFGGEARAMELQYLNPLMPYYATQWNSDLDDNVLVSFDVSFRLPQNIRSYLQFLIDDFNYADHDPNSLGYIVGLHLSDPIGFLKTDLILEYVRIDTWTYTHLVPENQYTHFAWVIGHYLGPDADEISIELSHMFSSDLRAKLDYEFKREGQRTIADRYKGEDYKRMKFPSGSVTRQNTIRAQLLWENLSGPQLNLSLMRSLKRSPKLKESGYGFEISLGYLLR